MHKGCSAVDDLLASPPAQRAGDPAAQVSPGVAVAFRLGCLTGNPGLCGAGLPQGGAGQRMPMPSSAGQPGRGSEQVQAVRAAAFSSSFSVQ